MGEKFKTRSCKNKFINFTMRSATRKRFTKQHKKQINV